MDMDTLTVVVVVVAAGLFLYRWSKKARRGHCGCSDCCGCDANKHKS